LNEKQLLFKGEYLKRRSRLSVYFYLKEQSFIGVFFAISDGSNTILNVLILNMNHNI